MGKEAATMAMISLVLTIVNILCIFITATAVLKVTTNCFLLSSFIFHVMCTKLVAVLYQCIQTRVLRTSICVH